MNPPLDETHDPKVQSWVESANNASSDFPVQNLPFGMFRRRGEGGAPRVGVASGDLVLDLYGMQSQGLLAEESIRTAANACASNSLNALMSLGTDFRRLLRRRLHAILREDAPTSIRQAALQHLVPQA